MARNSVQFPAIQGPHRLRQGQTLGVGLAEGFARVMRSAPMRQVNRCFQVFDGEAGSAALTPVERQRTVQSLTRMWYSE
jgi:hypothetical protein